MNIYEQARYIEEHIEDAKNISSFVHAEREKNTVTIKAREQIIEEITQDVLTICNNRSVSFYQTRMAIFELLNSIIL